MAAHPALSDKELEVYGRLKVSKNKAIILLGLRENHMPTELQKNLGHSLHASRVSDNLRKLVALELAECINKTQRKGKFYRQTALGEKLSRELLKESTYKAMSEKMRGPRS